MSTSTIQAPSANLEMRDLDGDDAGRDRAEAVDRRAPAASRAPVAQPPPVPHHARLAEREGDEDADRVERDQVGDAAVEGDDQQRRDDRQQRRCRW